jgi:hypothetical protein
MNKKGFLVVALAAIVCGSIFAVPGFSFSAGAGGLFQDYWQSPSFSGDLWDKVPDEQKTEAEDEFKTNTMGGGFFVFADATYAELNLGMAFLTEKNSENSDDKGKGYNYFSIGLLGKFPIAINEKLTVFPLLGFDYNIFLNLKSKNSDNTEVKRADLADWNQDSNYLDNFLINVGGGIDFNLTPALYLRGEILWAFKLNNGSEKDTVDMYDDMDVDLSLFTTGPKVKLAIGYKIVGAKAKAAESAE